MADNNDLQKLTRFLETLNERRTKFSTIKSAIKNTEESSNIDVPVNSCGREKKLHYLQKCLKENENCLSLLSVIESSIKLLLNKCVKEQQIVNANIELCSRKEDSTYKPQDRCMKRVFCAPYFKDLKNISSPFNKDVSKRNFQGFLNPYKVITHLEWSEVQKRKVVNFIRNVEEEKWTETLKSCGMLHLTDVKEMTLQELIESRYDEYDWTEISVSCLKNSYSPEECRLLWFLCLHPQINQEKWSKKENKKLKELVLQYMSQDWDKIVRELGTNRSVFLSFVHFQRHLSEMRKHEWSEKEVDVLKYYDRLFTFKGHKQWMKMKRFMDGFSVNEIVKMWKKINDEGKPMRFSFEEDIVLVAGMRTFGSNYARMAEYLPDRTPIQIFKRSIILKYRLFPKQPWSHQEDVLLINLVKKYGFGNWLKISMHFVNRNQVSVRTRYLTLMQCEKKKTRASSKALCVVKKSDPVNIPLLWESVKNICAQNNISVKNLDNSSVNIVHELSNILRPQMRCSKAIGDRKLKPFSDSEFTKFFLGAYMLNENHQKRNEEMMENIHSFVQGVIVVLKLLEAKINLPALKELKNDTTISCRDKFIIKYLMKKSESSSDVCCDIFLPPNSSEQNIVVDESVDVKIDDSHYLFPPNFSTLLAMRSLLLNAENREEQKEGLTMQVDNIDVKHMYSCCSPRKVSYSEKYTVASKTWIERMDQLLSGVAVMLKEKKVECSDSF